MVTKITPPVMLRWLEQFADLLAKHKDHLTALDSAIGDADHGANMDRGFKAVLAKRAALQGKDLGEIFKMTAMTLISTVGGASGPLYGTFFLQVGSGLTGRQEAGLEEFAASLEKGLAGVVQRGKASPGDKTMVDVLEPAIAAFKSAAKGGLTASSLAEVAASAEERAKATIPLLARKGRASYLGERSQGHQDPGATSAAYLFAALASALASAEA
ncbi:MAG: dihydroxyacetone kinase subunit L [Verrucomicrobia bacterium]|nr:dihydroxyacetone kinase subunit L [Verrucomicrobiota bacterium]